MRQWKPGIFLLQCNKAQKALKSYKNMTLFVNREIFHIPKFGWEPECPPASEVLPNNSLFNCGLILYNKS